YGSVSNAGQHCDTDIGKELTHSWSAEEVTFGDCLSVHRMKENVCDCHHDAIQRGRGQQSGEVLSSNQDFTTNRRQQIEMHCPGDHVAAVKIGEDQSTSEHDHQTQNES